MLVCNNFLPEISASIATEGWSDVVAIAFPAECGRPPLCWDDVRARLPPGCSRIVIVGRSCLAGLETVPPNMPEVHRLPQRQCFDLIADPERVSRWVEAGAHLITPAWLANWRERIDRLGFPPGEAAELFHESSRSLLLLDSGLNPDASEQFDQLCRSLDMPGQRIETGLVQTRLVLARVVHDWREAMLHDLLQQQKRQHQRTVADQHAAMDWLGRLTEAEREEDAIETMLQLFQMLFAPAGLHYLSGQGETIASQPGVSQTLLEQARCLQNEHAPTADGLGFLLRLHHGTRQLGVVALEQLAFPEYRERYLNLALAMAGVCALCIENACNRKRLLESEKMASLGLLVAGVAHEISTPLGISLTAASSLESQSRSLATHFRARSMTQSELTRYLETVDQGSQLLLSNLGRIGRLVGSFRQLAVQARPQADCRLALRPCLDAVLTSLAGKLGAKKVRVELHCEPEITVCGSTDDWISILTNLIDNSLQHGFSGDCAGSIQLEVNPAPDGGCEIIYRDDGAGMEQTALAQVFEPFFTTDVQHGMGLGMHLVFNLVTQRMGGRIQCTSSPGKGFKCAIVLPAAPEGNQED